MIKPNKIFTLVTLILAGESIFFLPFVLIRVFRPTFLKVFEINNLELGTAFSVYGIVAMFAYFFGGPLADRFSARSLMSSALWMTSLGGLVMALIPSYTVLVILYGYFGLTTIFLFWAAMIKATRVWGGQYNQGKAFGFLEGGRGLTAALIGSLALVLFSSFIDGDVAENRTDSIRIILLLTSIIIFMIGVLVYVAVPNNSGGRSRNSIPTLHDLKQVIVMPAVWLQGIIIIAAYVGYKATDDYSLYANEVLKYSEVNSAGVASTSLWLRPIFAIMAGLLADKFSSVRISIWSFIIMIGGSALIALGFLESSAVITLIVLLSTLVGVYGIRGIYFALMEDAAVPLEATGAAVGIMSVIGFMPDVFMSPLMGWLLDNNPGALGHRYVFAVLGIFSVIGLLASLVFSRLHSSHDIR